MAERIRYVNTAAPTGGNGTTNGTGGADPNRAYASLDEALDAEEKDLVTATDNYIFRCTGSSADTTSASLSSTWATSATYDIVIEPNTGEYHSGTYNTGVYRIETTSGYGHGIELQYDGAEHVTIDSMQIYVQGANAKGMSSFLVGSAGGEITIINNIVRGDTTGTAQHGIHIEGSAGNTFNIVNNVVYDCAQIGINRGSYWSSGNFYVYNNTVVSCGTGLAFGSGTATNRVYNNVLTDNTTDYSGGATPTSATNITSDATSPDGASWRNITVTYTNAGSDDYSTSDSDVVGQGTDMSSDTAYAFSTDCLGVTRSAWDCGAFEYQAPSGGSANDEFYKLLLSGGDL